MFVFLCFSLVALTNSQFVNYGEYYGNFTGPCTDKNHLFLTPGVLAAGGSNRVCLSRFYSEGAARLLVTLILENQQTVVNSRELSPGDGGCIDITVPQLPNTKAELVVNIRYPGAQCYWERRTTLRIASGKVLVVHTERARYRPGETLRARVFALKADLTPNHGVIDEMWVEGPRGAWEGARVAQWQRVRSKLGIAQIQHEIDELAPAGRWTVRAKLADGSQGSASFWVGNYDLPPFQLSVRHSPKILRTSDRLVWTVCVRYPWAEAVEGMLVIRLRGAGDTGPGDGNPSIRTAVRLRAPRACHRHAAASRRIGLDGANPPQVVVADFSFQEEGTRMWQNTTVISQVVDNPISLEFLTKHRVIIASGLPYKLKVKATRWDDKPAANEHLQVCRSAANETETDDIKNTTSSVCGIAVTDAEGIARVMFTAGDDHTLYYKFQARLRNDSSTRAPPLALGVQRGRGARAALGARARSLVPLYLALNDVTAALTVHFVVITRTGIIYRWGATTQCPITSSSAQILTSPRNGPCNAHVASLDSSRGDASSLFDANASDALLDRHLLRVVLPVKITQQMCPDSHLIAYFYYKGELITASKRFELDECLVNKVEATWVSRQTLPGSVASLRIETTGPALCALTVLDVAAKVPGQNIKDALMSRLRRLMESYRNLTEYDAAGDCFMNSESLDVFPSNNLELTATWLAAAGVRTLGSNIPLRRYCPKEAPSSLVADDGSVQRNDFSEAWLWKLVGIGANGTVVVNAQAPDSITKYEATAVCVAKNGVGISPPAVLQVFREFFIHADGPKRLRRGDIGILQYRIFNYLYQPLSVQVQIASNDRIAETESVWSACVGARASRARRAELRARSAGPARLALTARSVRDAACPNASAVLVSDVVILQIKIEPEGVPVHDHQSMLLCDKGNPETTASQISWSWPAVASVPGTETLTVWAAGDVTGPLYADADDLILLPRGCGEQNMARLALNFLSLSQLEADTPAAVTAKEHVSRGFTRQLQYINPMGGFSAFGASDATPSTWLTAFSIRYMRRIHQVLSPGSPAPPALERAERWLLGQQMENGCFRNEGQVFHRELKGGLNEDGEIANVALTAYVISSLAESSITLPSKVLRNTLSCLRAVPPLTSTNPSRVYPHSILAYTLMRLKTYEEDIRRTNDVSLRDNNVDDLKEDEGYRELLDLLKMAKRSGDYVWWETGSLSTSIEATGYAVLALARCAAALRAHCAGGARAAVRWLAAHRSPQGGFLSTQDTLVAIEALVTWSSVQPSTPTNLTVTAMSNSSIKSVRLAPADKIPEVMKMTLGDKLKVSVQGTGCALIQATRSYNTLSPAQNQDKVISVQVSVYTDGPFDCDANKTWCFCGARVEICVIWKGSFPEMALLEVSLPGGFGADASRLYSQLQQADTLLRRIEMSSSGSRVTMYLATRDGSGTAASGHQCVALHAVGPRAKTKPAFAKVMDYYRPDINDTQMYTIPEDCPLKISEINNEYSAKHNLYNKAKALNNDEVLITDEIIFEDLPDVIIPLDDTIYENLTQNNRNNNITENSKTNATHGNIKIAEPSNYETNHNHERYIEENATEIISTLNSNLHTTSTENDKANLNDESGIVSPKFSDFHVIDRATDLDVPTGMEGPIPSYVLPPKNFVAVLPPNNSPNIAVLPPVNVPNMNTALYAKSYWYYPHELYRTPYPPRIFRPTPRVPYRL